jgi:hypothetical protein
MLLSLLAAGWVAANEPDIILTERPVPSVEGAEKFITCGRLEVRIAYRNVWQRGVPALEGRMTYAGHAKSMAGVLDSIKPQLNSIYRVDLSCAGVDEVDAQISADLPDDKGYRRWLLNINQKLEVTVATEEMTLEEFD